jgi:archaellum component FlaF (FlaF/FlaG flagellin family)
MKRARMHTAGISESIAVLIMILVAAVVAGFVYIFLLGSTQTQTAAPDLVFDASLISINPGSCRLSVTVKNTGSVPLDRFNVYIGGTLVSIPPIATPSNPLPPGRSASSAGNVPCPSPGSSVVVEVVGGSGQNEIRKVARVVVQ